MTPSELYKLWAPDEARWSNWVKPVLFADAFSMVTYQPGVVPSPDVDWAPAADQSTAIVLDVDGTHAVWMGLALAARGYRPVPLFNGASGPSAVVDVARVAGALRAAANELAGIAIRPDAPPVFLLDARRSGGGTLVSPGRFDNRWVVFPQDFPSANFLLAHGLRNVLLVQSGAGVPKSDLAHVLLRWQEAGLVMWNSDLALNLKPAPLRVQRPGKFRHLWYRALVLAGLRRNSAGGFGAVVPEPSQSGGYG
jgi:hypothetical protein